MTTANENTAVGMSAAYNTTTGQYNTAIGRSALLSNTTASYNTAVGYQAGYSNTEGANNVTVGREAGYSNTTGERNTSVGTQSLYTNTTGSFNSAYGRASMYFNTTGQQNSAFGQDSLFSNTTGSYNVALGKSALQSNTTASDNTAVGYQSLYSNTTGVENIAIGVQALYTSTTAYENIGIGRGAGKYITTGSRNTLIGDDAGEVITTGSKNTIIGRFTGNANGLDIRTASNNIVLANGDGVPRMHFNGGKEFMIPQNANAGYFTAISTDPVNSIGDMNRSIMPSAAYARIVLQERAGKWISFVNGTPVHYGTISVSGSGVSYGSNSDHRLKENITNLTNATDRLKQLSPKRFNFINNPTVTTDGFLAHEVQDIVPEAVTGTFNGSETFGNVVDADGVIVQENVNSDFEISEGQTFVEVKVEPMYQQIDQSKLVPLLVKTIQELEARITALES